MVVYPLHTHDNIQKMYWCPEDSALNFIYHTFCIMQYATSLSHLKSVQSSRCIKGNYLVVAQTTTDHPIFNLPPIVKFMEWIILVKLQPLVQGKFINHLPLNTHLWRMHFDKPWCPIRVCAYSVQPPLKPNTHMRVCRQTSPEAQYAHVCIPENIPARPSLCAFSKLRHETRKHVHSGQWPRQSDAIELNLQLIPIASIQQ